MLSRNAFLESLATPEDCRNATDRISAESHVPTVLYGAGVYANEVGRFLERHSVNVVGRFVDDEYLEDPSKCANGVSRFAQIQLKYPRFNIVIAFCGHHDIARKRIASLKSDHINAVHVYDCRFWERFASLNLDFIHENMGVFQMVYNWLSDEQSRSTYVTYINTKLTFDPTLIPSIRSSTQYFPEDLPMFAPRSDDEVIDGGAYTGDTLSIFLARTGGVGCRKYYALEPDENNAAELASMARHKNLDFVEIVRRGLWSHQDTLRFEGAQSTRSLIAVTGDTEIQTISIDDLSTNASFIKMDIEGAELDALKGAEYTIKTFRPRLAIAVYHFPSHLIDIPCYIKSICKDYKFYLRIHSIMSEELVLYATVE